VILPLLVFAQIGTVQFQTRVSPDTVYVGQQVTYDAITLVDDLARTRLKENPTYTPAEVRGMTVYDFPFDTAAITSVASGGTNYRRYVYRRALFPLAPGRYDVPPATLQYSLPESDSYYAQRTTYTAHSVAASIVAIPLPASGRPMEFAGVVGQFTDTMYSDGAAPRVGDGFTLTVRVSGVGNITLLPRPTLRLDWADVVAGEERVRWDSTGSVVRGAKEFDWVVTPRVAGALFIPAVRYDYFDPEQRRYAAAVTAALPVQVAGGSAVRPESARVAPDSIGDTPFPAIQRAVRDHWIATIAAAVLLVVLVIWLAVRRRGDGEDD